MGHEDFSAKSEVRSSSDRAFGLVFAVLFAVVGLFSVPFGGAVRWWALGIGAAFLAASVLAPRVLAPLNRVWTRFGLLLHTIVSPVVLGFMFFLVVTPTGLLMRLFRKDPLRLRFDPEARTYWVERDPPGPAPEGFRDQF